MKHILTTNEPFLLERNNIQTDVGENSIVAIESTPFVGNESFFNYGFCSRCRPTNPSSTPKISGTVILVYLENSIDIMSSSSTDFTTEIGKILGALKFDTYQSSITQCIVDLNNNKIYISTTSIGAYNGSNFYITNYQIIAVYDYTFSENQLYSMDREFGTKIYFTTGLMQYDKVPDTTYEDTDPEAWIWCLGFQPKYWDTVRLHRGLPGIEMIVQKYSNNESISAWTEGTSGVGYFDYILGKLGSLWYNWESYFSGRVIDVPVYLTPTIYWDYTKVGTSIGGLRIIPNVGNINYGNNYSYRLLPIQGRFVAGTDDTPITSEYTDMIFPDTNPSIVSGHTYEFNIFDGVFNLIDVTQTTT